MKVATKTVFGGLAAALVLLCLSPVSLYLYGLTLLPSSREPENPNSVPRIARTLLWKEVGGGGQPEIPVLNPYTYFTAPSGAGMTLVVIASRKLFRSGEPPHP